MSLKTLILRSFVGPLVCTLLACSLLSQAANAAVVEAKAENNFLDWKFTARPETTVAGEAPVTGIQDHDGGSASLNFTLSGVMGNSRRVRLQQTDFEAAGISGVTKLKHLSSISWRIHHSDPLSYPRFIVTLKALPQGPPGDEFYYKKYESLAFCAGEPEIESESMGHGDRRLYRRGGAGLEISPQRPVRHILADQPQHASKIYN